VDQQTQILHDLKGGDPHAAERLLPLVYDHLRAIAGSYFRNQRSGHTLQPTALVHEAFLRLTAGSEHDWKDRAHFSAVCAMAMRSILADHARRRFAAKRGGGRQRVTLSAASDDSRDGIDVLDLDEALSKLSALNERQGKIVELRLFGGMTMDEIAHHLDISKTTVEGDWRMARAWLSAHLGEHAA